MACNVRVLVSLLLLPISLSSEELCKEDYLENLAPGGSVSQSGNPVDAYLATDEDIRPAILEHSKAQCSYTNAAAEGHAWWQVDLSMPSFTVTNLIIYSKIDSSTEFIVGVGDELFPDGYILHNISENTMKFCYTAKKIFISPTRAEITCGNFSGTIITIISPDVTKSLILCEVEVYGKNGFNIALNKPTAQSSTEHNGESSLAVDGGVHLMFYDMLEDLKARCTHTSENVDSNPWWRVDLEEEFIIEKLKIYNRGEGLAPRLHDVEIRIGSTDIASETDAANNYFIGNPLCKSYVDEYLPFGLTTVECDQPLFGRYVSIQIIKLCDLAACIESIAHVKNILTLCEVEIFGDVIRRDENARKEILRVHPEFNTRETYSIDKSSYPWFVVDLESENIIDQIVITMKNPTPNGETFGGVLPDIAVRVGNKPAPMSYLFCAGVRDLSVTSGGNYVIKCWYPILGRYLTMQVMEDCKKPSCLEKLTSIDHIQSIDVWGYASSDYSQYKLNVAAYKPTSQSSTAFSGYSSLAVSRWMPDMESSSDKCSKTFEKKYPWWRVDLHKLHHLSYVVVHTPYFGNFSNGAEIQIRVGTEDVANQMGDSLFFRNPVCSLSDNEFEGVFECEPSRSGRYVSVHLVTDGHPYNLRSLELCEVEVYGCEINSN